MFVLAAARNPVVSTAHRVQVLVFHTAKSLKANFRHFHVCEKAEDRLCDNNGWEN